MPDTPDKPIPDPQAGGRYERLKDGSLRQVHATEDAPMRDKREAEAKSEINNDTAGTVGDEE